MRDIAEWLVDIRFPFDWTSKAPPEKLIPLLAQAWYESDNFDKGKIIHKDVTVQDYEDMIRAEFVSQ